MKLITIRYLHLIQLGNTWQTVTHDQQRTITLTLWGYKNVKTENSIKRKQTQKNNKQNNKDNTVMRDIRISCLTNKYKLCPKHCVNNGGNSNQEKKIPPFSHLFVSDWFNRILILQRFKKILSNKFENISSSDVTFVLVSCCISRIESTGAVMHV